MIKTITQISRFLVGLVFLFSGFVKAVDPLGSSYKFQDYLVAFGLSDPEFLTLLFAVALSSLEFLVGFAILLNVNMKRSGLLALVFMIIFTGLTFYIALENPVSDCGCFGDAIKLTNWQTFYKNVIILVFSVILFANHKVFPSRKRVDNIFLSLSGTVLILTVSLHSYFNLPLIDFRPYSEGTNLREAMHTEENEEPQFETTLVYRNKNTGEEKEFPEDDYPWQDTATWEFVEMQSVEISSGTEPEIQDFSIVSMDLEDNTTMALNDPEYNFLLIAYDLDKAGKKNLEKINTIARYCMANGFGFRALTAEPMREIEDFKARYPASYPFFNTDPTTLKTIIRSNPGLIMLKDGIIIKKWHKRNIPGLEELKSNYLNQ